MGSLSNSPMMQSVEGIREAQRAQGTATIMAIGLANPPNFMEQSDYADFLFRITNSEDKVELKQKFQRICKRTMIKRRYFHHDEEYLKQHPNIDKFMAPSLNDRQNICVSEVLKLGKEAAVKALEEWGPPKSLITHLVFCTSCGVDMPSADFRLATVLGLRLDVSHYCLYMQGCYAGGTVIRYSQDLAENNRDARVLVVCSELVIIGHRAPMSPMWAMPSVPLYLAMGRLRWSSVWILLKVLRNRYLISYVPSRGLFRIVEEAIHLHLREEGMLFHLSKETPNLIANNIEQCLADAFDSVGMKLPSDWNSLFWVPHPGGRAILDEVQPSLKLRREKFRATRRILWEYGNMISACVLFILDELRNKSAEDGLATTGEGLEWGVPQGFGPGMTIETVLLSSRNMDFDPLFYLKQVIFLSQPLLHPVFVYVDV